jgi:hypothetical protein
MSQGINGFRGSSQHYQPKYDNQQHSFQTFSNLASKKKTSIEEMHRSNKYGKY